MGISVSLDETKIKGSGLKMKIRLPVTQWRGVGVEVDSTVGAAGVKGRDYCSCLGREDMGDLQTGKEQWSCWDSGKRDLTFISNMWTHRRERRNF